MQGFPASLGLAHCACTGLAIAVDVGVDNANSSILRFRVFEATLVAVEFNVPTTEVFCLHGFVDWCRFASTSIHCPSAADMGEVLLARLLLFLLACCLPPCLLPQVPQMGAWAHRTLEPADEPLLHEHYCMNSSSHGAWSKNPSQKS